MQAADRPGAWAALAGCLLGVFMQMLDTTVVNIALPDLTTDLGASTSQQLLVLTVYTLAFACALLPAANLGARLGRRRLFVTGMIAFTVTSVLCGVAVGPWDLIVFRGAQGVSAALMSAQTLALIATLFGKHRHGLVFGIYGAVAGIAAILGPVVGGVLVDADVLGWGWRTIFFINVPLGVLACLLARSRLPVARDDTPARMDVIGVLLSSAGLFLLLCPLALGRETGWPPILWVMIAAAVVFLASFAIHEIRVDARGGTPLLRPQLFRSRRFTVGLILSLLFFSVFAGFFFTVSISAQFGLGCTATRTGMVALPFAVGAAIGSLASAPLVVRIGSPRGLFAGSLTVGAGLAWLAAVIDPSSESLSTATILGPLALAGVGTGLFIAPLQTVILSDTTEATVGTATGSIPTVQQIGASIGLAVVTIFFFAQVSGQSTTTVPEVRSELAAALSHSPVAPYLHEPVADRFAACASTQLRSSHPERPVPGCTGSAGSTAVATVAAQTRPWTDDARQSVSARTFLGALRVTLAVLSGVAVAIGVLTLALRDRRTDR
ncbi:MFS transporter [Gordonia sp. 'Campus']|uniref:MFS transporter n=1 Tax=Gordonia sp. 'Campus' TaxID=2915824 RepID=UPI00247A5366|nr:MFS transporter [Gordonia sp. 'Campus']